MKLCPSCFESFGEDASFCPFDGNELRRSTDPHLGRTLAARYRLVRRIGAGGMSLVYLARHVMIDRMSAIKILRQDLGLSPVHRERFLREARAVNRINHPNIVEITDFGEHDGLSYLVMEYVPGESLVSHVRRARLPWARAAKIARQIAAALARAHQAGVIHRDLKPENVLLAEGDRVKLTDFGIAKLVDAPALTFTEQMFGTPGYIAPEYVEGLPGDGRADLYALGVVLYEAITQKLPYDARTQADLLVAPLKHAPVPPRARLGDADDVPPDLEALMLRMLAKRPEDRPRDAFEVIESLDDVLRRFGRGAGRAPTTPDETDERTQVDSARAEDLDSTLSDAGAEEAKDDLESTQNRLTREVAGSPTIEIASRWHAAIAELEAVIARAKRHGGKRAAAAEHAAQLVETARAMVGSVERASARVAEHQAKVDRLEARGRAFRANLGRAIDELVKDRSRERAHAEALAAAREGKAKDEAAVWEAAAIETEIGRARAVDEDLTFQIDTLQKQLDTENEQLDNELAGATGALEGSLAALRLLTSEIVRTMDDAAAAVSETRRR